MSIISFDVGIKNMGYCIFKLNCNNNNNLPFEISDWGILNLTKPTNSIVHFCNCINKSKSKGKGKKENSIECKKIAKYTKIQNGENPIVHYYCKKHATNSGDPIISNMKCMLSNLKKSTKEIIIQKCKEMNIDTINDKDTKPNILKILETHIKENSIQLIETEKHCSANDIDLISIGKQMKIMLDANPYINEITHVIIENQISPIANRMKTIQGMLAQYFIMKNININIEFVSSANKLKQFSNMDINLDTDVVPDTDTDSIQLEVNSSVKVNTTYKEHKKDGIFYCDKILSNNEWLSEWTPKINIKKKDDLADCFLQGLWYLKKTGHIQYLDNLLIAKI